MENELSVVDSTSIEGYTVHTHGLPLDVWGELEVVTKSTWETNLAYSIEKRVTEPDAYTPLDVSAYDLDEAINTLIEEIDDEEPPVLEVEELGEEQDTLIQHDVLPVEEMPSTPLTFIDITTK